METVTTKNKLSARFIASVGILSGIAVVLMQILEFPIPFMPPFLKLDFSTLPALIGGFAYGPVTGVAICFIKALLHLLRTETGGVGELADFLASASLTLTASLIYMRGKSRKNAILGMVLGTIAIMVVGSLANWFILIPFYANVMPMDQIIELCGKVNPLIQDRAGYVLFGAAPFNLIKGIIICLLTFLVYKKTSKILYK
jgi:riboflavin transporter FmnP